MKERWQLEVREGQGGIALSYVFTELPITIGRHEGNDVRLPRPFVSSFHARIERTGAGLSVLDLGSTNGVRVRAGGGRERRLTRSEPQPLSGCDNEFAIGAYRIRVQSAAAAAAPSGSELLSLPALGSSGSDGSAALDSARLDSALPSLPALHTAPPRAPAAAAARSERRALEAAALAELEQLTRALVPAQRLDTAEQVAELVRRLQLALELSCRGLVRLRHGQRRCASALQLPGVPAAGQLQAGSHEQLARQLLDERLPLGELRAALSAEFQALARHQVALLDGMIEGAAALVQELSPERLEARVAHEHARRGWLPLLGKLHGLRRAYREQHAQLSRRDGALSLLFGRAFREAYAAYLRAGQAGASQGSARRRRQLR